MLSEIGKFLTSSHWMLSEIGVVLNRRPCAEWHTYADPGSELVSMGTAGHPASPEPYGLAITVHPNRSRSIWIMSPYSTSVHVSPLPFRVVRQSWWKCP